MGREFLLHKISKVSLLNFYYIFCSGGHLLIFTKFFAAGCHLKLRWKSLQNQKDFCKLQDFIKSNLSGFDICKY